MKQHQSYMNHRDVSDDDDEDDDDDRKPPARNNYPQQSPPSNNEEDNEDDDGEEGHYSESGVGSHTSSTAAGSVDHLSFRDTSSTNTSQQYRYWWTKVFSPFQSSTSSYSSKGYDLSDPSKLAQRLNDRTQEDHFVYQTPTNACMINAIRNEIHTDPHGTYGSTAIPSLTFATRYTPDNHHVGADETPQTTNASDARSSNASKVMNTKETSRLVVKSGGNATMLTTTTTTIGTTSPSSPIDHITNSTISTLQRNSVIYLGSTTLAWVVLFSHILPPVVLYTLLWIFISTVLMIQTFYTTIQEYYYHMVVMGPGLGSLLLPQSVYNLLTQESLHEFLTDEVMVLEYRHLLLYFLPISSVQLRDLLRRISPQHQQRLQQRGEIGTLLFGEPVMRIILGHTQYEQWRTRRSLASPSASILSDDGNHRTTEIPRNHTLSSIPRQVTSQNASQRRNTTLILNDSFDDEHSDLGLDISADDMIGGNAGLAERLGLTATTSLSPNSNNTRPLPNEVVMPTSTTTESNRATEPLNATTANNEAAARVTAYDDQEYQVLIDALWDSFYGAVWNPITDYVTTTYMVPTLHRISRITLHSGIVLLSISTGNVFGLWEWWYQLLNNSLSMYLPTRGLLWSAAQNRNPSVSSRRVLSTLSLQSFGLHSRPSTTTWSTAILGSASLGISYYSRRYVRLYHTTGSLDANNNRNETASNGHIKSKLSESSKKK